MCFRKIIAFSRQIRLCTDSGDRPPRSSAICPASFRNLGRAAVRLREVASAPFGNQPSFADGWLWVAATQTLQLRQHPQSHFLNRQKISDELNVKNVVASTSPRNRHRRSGPRR